MIAQLPRNAQLPELIEVLRDQQARKHDVVVKATTPRFANNSLILPIGEAELTEDGVSAVDGVYRVTDAFDEGMATRLKIPQGYLRRTRDVPWHPDGDPLTTAGETLYDHNVNALLQDKPDARYLLRLLRNGAPDEHGYHGVARAMLSDSYKMIDHIDSLMAMLSGVRAAGIQVEVDSADLTDRRMYVRVRCPEIATLAPKLLQDYRSPFDHGIQRAGGWTIERARAAAGREGLGYEPGQEPVVFAGFVFSNSETGHGRFSITPEIVVRVCRNGLSLPVGGLKRQHLGAKLDEGIWSAQTEEKNLQLITSQTRDVVASILSLQFLEAQVAELEKIADAPVTDTNKTLEVVTRKLQFGEEVQNGLLEHFVVAGQRTAAGVANAMTSLSQTLGDADLAAELNSKAIPAMRLVAELAQAG